MLRLLHLQLEVLLRVQYFLTHPQQLLALRFNPCLRLVRVVVLRRVEPNPLLFRQLLSLFLNRRPARLARLLRDPVHEVRPVEKFLQLLIGIQIKISSSLNNQSTKEH